ncbi:MAG: hypothetical protein M3R44_00015 [Candidatus Eremiobacteraeota bacterium]|nr:hypothetical protein [Candidatus Eremiobacteraeota bacterium]
MAPLFALVAVLLLGVRGAAASPAPTATPREPLRTIGRVHAVTAFCKAFQAHFNGAVVPLLAADAQLGYMHFTMGRIEPDYRDRVPEQRLYDDRVKLIAYLKMLFAQIAPAQSEINALRDTAKGATDPQTAKATVALASQLQRALDKQHSLAVDSLGVVHAMIDVATGTNLTWIPPPLDAPQTAPQQLPMFVGGDDLQTQQMPKAERDVRNIISFDKQLDRIGDAEENAATGADAISSNC